ncbi:uncharacterized protein VICG_01623 [Vittaforma corneae ATCC 50505]|uniref:60S ribosomal protein L8 n=1 Tax=Vittaforma corneae (strain ATCC 50505) TaxID=993615 RepID=L2GM56_VITCO|nr:uncharacterized protein VICG_01623 [Vittaforma corneae ATCC 50505]ELA41382.1 hypothetical protein VICG_01623 [Vittaforma corneae ATCC 50505]
MALGKTTKRVRKVEPVDPEAREAAIQKKIYNLANAIKIPPPINQFKTQLQGSDLDRLLDILRKYRPETKDEKIVRLQKTNPKEGPRPIILKFGLRHVVDLIEQKKLGLVVVAADVAPITLVISIPTLCKKFGIPYAIVPSKSVLGSLVHVKTSAVVGLEGVKPEDQKEFDDIVRICNALFMSQYEKHMTTVGGRIAQKAEL